MPHMEMMEIVLHGYMPEVEGAAQSPDSWAPASRGLPSNGVLVCPEGLAERGQCCSHVYSLASLLHPGNCRVRDCSAALGVGTVPLGCCRAERNRR